MPLAFLLTACAGQLPLASRLAASEASGSSCTAAASKAAARSSAVLADVLNLADQRAGDLVEVADQVRARGMTCGQAYYGLSGHGTQGERLHSKAEHPSIR
ncbi:DUF2514 family protein [Geopseudomonas aromaticivorans]|uniref:DUF2514 family protein n=1 Tax=Geopseudomonas aromaticivorans TaxID=2849492 RepID=UPI0020C8520B|nr:DUF2514 family protein [Pseudomonas aromaticivorans]